MLIEFSVSNYRSFREKQIFSMVAAPRLKKGDNVFKPFVKGEKLPNLLKVAAIYGPNASGKSNLIKAFGIVSYIANRKPSAQPTLLPVFPFRFDPQLADQPSRVELNFVYAEQRYEFELALTQDRIIEERLLVFPSGKETLLYERRHLPSGDEYIFGPQLEGGKDLHELWRKSTGPQMLFLTQAVANSSEELNQLRKPLTWLQNGFMIVADGMEVFAGPSQMLAEVHAPFAEEISSFLQDVDVPVTHIRFDQIEPNSTEQTSAGMLGSINPKPKSKTILTHRTALGEAEFDFQEESEGTKNLIGFWLPWNSRGQSNFNNENRTLVVDELDSSLHPEIVVSLVAKHIKSDSPAQLIFTTHDTHLMDAKLLRRDQFWLTERDANGATQLRSIHDFEGRESEDLEKRYYEGRYRGLPFVRKG
ncbi:MAG: ATP-binding protein [Methylobacter tundripaludum]|nr:ATP-binding protein [Methylobacter tundripaludum]